jgi:hypothetical protein
MRAVDEVKGSDPLTQGAAFASERAAEQLRMAQERRKLS